MSNIQTGINPEAYKALLGPQNFKLSFQKFPDLIFHLQSANLPALTLGVSTVNTSVNDVPLPGESLEFDNLSVSFIVDSNMVNYMAIHTWLVGMGFPVDHSMYRDLLARETTSPAPITELAKGFTDATLIILENNQLPIIECTFTDCFPIRISGLSFDASVPDNIPMVATVDFAYAHYLLKVSTQ